MIMRHLFICFVFLFSSVARADEEHWYALNREDGCEPLTWIYDSLPQLKGNTTPSSILKTLKQTYPDAKAESFLDVIAKEHETEGSTPTKEENTAYKSFTHDNAFVITFEGHNRQLILLTEKLCRSIYGSLDKK
jgi:hypothetical protein